MKLSWWGECPRDAKRFGTFLYADGLCILHSSVGPRGATAGDGLRAPQSTPADDCGPLPTVATGKAQSTLEGFA